MMKYGAISQEDEELYVFGVHQTLISGLEILLMLITGIVWGVGWKSVIFLLAFMILRRYAGGYHASTLPRCVLMSWGLVCMACAWVNMVIIDTWIQIMLLIVGGVLIIMYAPVQDKHKKLYEYEIKTYKKYSLKIWCAEVLLYGILLGSGHKEYAQCIIIGVTMVAVVMCMSTPWKSAGKVR